MKLKKEYLILAVVICALSGYLLAKRESRMNYELPEVPSVEKKSITGLELEKSGQRIVLTKKDDSWYIAPGDFPADSSKVEKMLGAIEELKLTTLVSESGDYLRYELNDEKKVAVKALKGTEQLLLFDVGRTAPTFKHTFVKMEGDKKVYQAKGNFRTDFDQDGDDLRDKKVLSFEESAITGIEIVEGEKSVALARKKPAAEENKDDTAEAAAPVQEADKWVDTEGREIAEKAVSSLYSPLSNLECESYVGGKNKGDFTNPLLTVTLKGDKSYSLSVFARAAEEDAGYPAVSSESDYPFILQGYRVDNLKRAAGEIRGEKSEE